MAKNNNSSHVWDNLLARNDYLADCGMITKKRVGYAKKWISGHTKVLNIGSGQGYIERSFSSEIQGGTISWTSLDISTIGLNRIKRLIPKINCVKGNILNLPFSEGSFEVVICMEVIEHLDKKDANKAMSEILKMGRKNASYIISVPIYEPVSLVNHPVGHNRKFTPNIINKELIDNGFTVIDSKLLYAFNSGYPIKSLICKYINIRRPSVVMFLCQRS